MAKLLLFFVLGSLAFMLTCTATVYTVGDSSGWDISTDLDSWVNNKSFNVGDVLLFQYSSTHSVNEVTRDSFNRCNVTNVLRTSSDGNTSIPLPNPGEKFFICGNRLHCLGGMKLQVNVNGDSAASSPAGAPEGPSSLPPPSSKNPSLDTPTSTGFHHAGKGSLIVACIGVFGSLFSFALI